MIAEMFANPRNRTKTNELADQEAGRAAKYDEISPNICTSFIYYSGPYIQIQPEDLLDSSLVHSEISIVITTDRHV